MLRIRPAKSFKYGGRCDETNRGVAAGIVGVVVGMAVVTAGDGSSVSEDASQPATVAVGRAAQAIGLETFRDIAKAQMPMVVNIRTESRRQTRGLSEFFDRDLLERFFGLPELPRQPREQVNRSPVGSAAEASSALRGVGQNDTAFVLAWRQGQELFLTTSRE